MEIKVAKIVKKCKKISKKSKNNNQKRADEFIKRAWYVIDLCLDAMENRLSLMVDDAGSVDLSKLTQMFSSLFDRLVDVVGNANNENTIKKIEDFD